MSNCSCNEKGGHLAATVAGTLERPRYAPGLILQDTDLTLAVDYTRSLNQLLFRSLFGCGVICGLTVSVKDEGECGLKVIVQSGLGLDGCGEPVQLPAPVTLTLDKRDGVLAQRQDNQVTAPRRRDFWITACAGERQCAPRALECDADELDGTKAATRTRSTTTISIGFEKPTCICGCAPAKQADGDDDTAVRKRALRMLAVGKDGQDDGGDTVPDCQHDHTSRVECADDCGCGSACSCGCCLLLAWVTWVDPASDGNGGTIPGGWAVLHNGVRRFIRPAMLPDPMAGLDPVLNAGVTGYVPRQKAPSGGDQAPVVVASGDGSGSGGDPKRPTPTPTPAPSPGTGRRGGTRTPQPA